MADADNYQDTLLFKLSQQECMGYFKFVILVGSFQDSYAPFDSARVQVCS
jgi:hypothetical protein